MEQDSILPEPIIPSFHYSNIPIAGPGDSRQVVSEVNYVLISGYCLCLH
jgi:hypothetical protein